MAPRLRRVATEALTSDEVRQIRALMFDAFGTEGEDGFTEDDWQHALGGIHFVLDLDGGIVAHASVVERRIQVGALPIRTGYVEAVATDPRRQRRGLGTQVMRDVDSYIREEFDLGALGTEAHGFYERLGWRTWRGPSGVRTEGGTQPTPDEDGYIMVLTVPSSPELDPQDPISCEWRPGDAW